MHKNGPMPAEVANKIYDVLVTHAGASNEESSRISFVHEFSKRERPTSEYRFMGKLGFGGKFRYPAFTVDCYPEDETPARRTVIEHTNQQLAALAAT